MPMPYSRACYASKGFQMVLAEVKSNGVYRVKAFRGDGDLHRHLENLGFIPGDEITVISRNGGNLIVNVKGARVALSSELAKHIMI